MKVILLAHNILTQFVSYDVKMRVVHALPQSFGEARSRKSKARAAACTDIHAKISQIYSCYNHNTASSKKHSTIRCGAARVLFVQCSP